MLLTITMKLEVSMLRVRFFSVRESKQADSCIEKKGEAVLEVDEA